MRRLVVSEFLSIDGVMQAPGGPDGDTEGGFEDGGWTGPFWHDDIGAAFGELMQGVDAFLLGRKTYVIHANAFEPLFPENVHKAFQLKSATPYPSGVVGLHYQRSTAV